MSVETAREVATTSSVPLLTLCSATISTMRIVSAHRAAKRVGSLAAPLTRATQ